MRFASILGVSMVGLIMTGCSSSSSSKDAGASDGATPMVDSSGGGTPDTGAGAVADSSTSGAVDSSTGTTNDSSAGSIADTGAPPDATTATDAGTSSLFSFFVTSVGSGDAGGDLGGVAGADAKCQMLAAAVGAGGRTWHAYLSTGGATPVNARDRIGSGPWYNVRGAKIAGDLAQLHEEGDAGMNWVSATTALDENGNPIPTGTAGTTNQHDILTGSDTGGRALPGSPDLTCAAWTSSLASGAPTPDGGPVPAAQVGHENRTGTNAPPASMSWNSSHATPGCAAADLQRVGGAGRLYCFATN
jgi:hypothetical protein